MGITVCVTILQHATQTNLSSAYPSAHSYSLHDFHSFRQVCAAGRSCEGDFVEPIQILAHVQGEKCVCVCVGRGVRVYVSKSLRSLFSFFHLSFFLLLIILFSSFSSFLYPPLLTFPSFFLQSSSLFLLLQQLLPGGGLTGVARLVGSHYEIISIIYR